jgi:hypothetical protein
MLMRVNSRFKPRFRKMSVKILSAGRHFPLPCAILLTFLTGFTHAQSIQVPAATVLSIQLRRHVPMKAGEALEGSLLYPLYVDNRVAIPEGTILRGRVIQLDPDRSRRIHARFRGDFTAFRSPVVRFNELVLPGGIVQSIVSDDAKDGVPILHLSPPPGQKKGSLISREIAAEKQQIKDLAALVTAPGRGDRLVQFLYTQLPWHPQRIESGTAWTVSLAQPLNLQIPDPLPEPGATTKPAAEVAGEEWHLHAYLQQTVSSANEKLGDTFQALVSEPVFNAQHSVVVPQGSLLVGEVTQTKPARSFGRQGRLRFRFRELRLPTGFSQPVEATLAGVDSDKSANLQIDPEGGIQPRPQNRVLLPLALTILAGRGFDQDESRFVNGAVASNGFGIVGRIVGIVATSRNVAAGIGVYGAALAFYDLWLAHGHNVVFVKNTRIDVTTTPARNPLNTPSPPSK